MDNLWGDLPGTDEIRTPTQVLKHQASFLSDLTRGVLYGEVDVHTYDDDFLLDLKIVAPELSNYTYEVVHVKHPLEVYPLRVWAGWEKHDPSAAKECPDEAALITTLERILKSNTVRRAVATLMAQSRS